MKAFLEHQNINELGEGGHYLCALPSTSPKPTWTSPLHVWHLPNVDCHVFWWVLKLENRFFNPTPDCFRLFAAMCALLLVFLFRSCVWAKPSADDGVGWLHYLCIPSSIVALLSAIVCLHAYVNRTRFLLELFHSTCNGCSFWTAGGLGCPWWLFDSRDLLFGEEPLPILASSRSKVNLQVISGIFCFCLVFVWSFGFCIG